MRLMIAREKGDWTNDTPLPEPEQLHHELGYVIRTWNHFRNHNVYPRAGGYDDQDSDLMEDWAILDLFKDRVEAGLFLVVNVPDGAFTSSWAETAAE